jgi:hypothetical protein
MMSDKMKLLMVCKKSHDAKHDKESPQYKTKRQIAESKRQEAMLTEFLNGKDEAAWREELKGEIVNDDFMGQLLLEFALFYIKRHQAKYQKKPLAPNVTDYVRVVLRLLRSNKSIPTGGRNTTYLHFQDLLEKSENFRKFWNSYQHNVKTGKSATPAFTQDLLMLGAACSPFPSELALRAFLYVAPLAADMTRSLQTW